MSIERTLSPERLEENLISARGRSRVSDNARIIEEKIRFCSWPRATFDWGKLRVARAPATPDGKR